MTPIVRRCAVMQRIAAHLNAPRTLISTFRANRSLLSVVLSTTLPIDDARSVFRNEAIARKTRLLRLDVVINRLFDHGAFIDDLCAIEHAP